MVVWNYLTYHRVARRWRVRSLPDRNYPMGRRLVTASPKSSAGVAESYCAVMTHANELVEIERRGRVLVVSISREAKRNAVDRRVADGIDSALNLLEDDPELWVGVLTGTRTVFSAGSDLTANGDYVTDRGGEYGIIRRRRRKPLIAAVEGPALGGGLEIVLACDLVVASTLAKFGLPEVKIGVVAACAGLFRAPRSLPLNLARELILTGDPIDAERAYAAGFVNALAAPGDCLEVAVQLAERVCANAPLAVQESLLAVNELLEADHGRGWELTDRAQESVRGTDDWNEGVASFLEKRRPVWTGH
jgi:enoyl-CoA hydratase/carnithine racemase